MTWKFHVFLDKLGVFQENRFLPLEDRPVVSLVVAGLIELAGCVLNDHLPVHVELQKFDLDAVGHCRLGC